MGAGARKSVRRRRPSNVEQIAGIAEIAKKSKLNGKSAHSIVMFNFQSLAILAFTAISSGEWLSALK